MGFKCRKYLDIKHKSSHLIRPDIMVIMMNPGSSYPIDGIDDNTKTSETVPDKTQNQIMKVMINTSYNYARILNLSDLRTAKSKDLFSFIKSYESNNFPHSIFNPLREKDLDKLIIKGAPVIFAWGVDNILIDLAKLAAKSINYTTPVGLQKPGRQFAYYHPLPRIYEKQVTWVNKISEILMKQRM